MSKVKMGEILETPMELNMYGDGALAKAVEKTEKEITPIRAKSSGGKIDGEKRRVFSIYITQRELDIIIEKAKKAGISTSSYLRIKALEG